MDKEKAKELKELILKEIEFRKEFREQRDKLESLVDPITKHIKTCCKWWDENLTNVEEMVVIMNNGKSLKIKKPKLEDCSVISYLPFGIDYTECDVIDID